MALSGCGVASLDLGRLDSGPGADIGVDSALPDRAIPDVPAEPPVSDRPMVDVGPQRDVPHADVADAAVVMDTPTILDVPAVMDIPVDACPTAYARCGGVCTDVAIDPANCGRCGRRCAAGLGCALGVCACPAGSVGTPMDTCVVTAIDPTHCGAAMMVCRNDQVCVSGACVCRPGLTAVGALCVDLRTDPLYCGSPTTVCAGDQVCVVGACADVHACDSFGHMQLCGAACVDLRSDPLHCGDCGTACAVGTLCTDGTCVDYTPVVGCLTCPCPGCSMDAARCCMAPGGGDLPVCVASPMGHCP